MKLKTLPRGVQDVLPQECGALAEIERKLKEKFASAGFEPVMSASLERFDTYSDIKNAVPEERMFKLTDTDGRLLVLRPDATLSISRLAATRLGGGKARLSYFAHKWDLAETAGLSSREVYQAGVECLGEEGALSDALLLAFAAECLEATGLGAFVLDVGHAGFFKGVLEECGLSVEDEEAVRGFICAKDGYGAERILRRAGSSSDAVDAVLELPTLFGTSDVFARAEKIAKNERAKRALCELKQIYSYAEAFGFADRISFDLGTVKSLSYYSGVVFSGLAAEMGAPVLSGGRYDDLADDFGRHIPAVGFAMSLKRILVALERQDRLPAVAPLDTIVFAAEGGEKAAMEVYRELRAQGKRVKFSAERDPAKEEGHAAKRYLVTREGIEEC